MGEICPFVHSALNLVKMQILLAECTKNPF